MAWTHSVLRLQDVDHELTNIHQRLREIEAQLRDNAELLAAEKAATERAETAQTARKQQQALEHELGQVQIKRDLTEQNLYSGRITNSRELQDLQAELQSLKRRVSTLEDELLEAMMVREEADAEAQAAAAHLDQLRADSEQAQGTLVAERDRLRAAAAELAEERQTLRNDLPPAILDSYDYLKDRTAGIPVAELKGDTCGICGTIVLRPTRQKVERGQEAYCDSCRRLLVK